MLSFIEKEANAHVEEAEEAEGQEDAEGLLGRLGCLAARVTLCVKDHRLDAWLLCVEDHRLDAWLRLREDSWRTGCSVCRMRGPRERCVSEDGMPGHGWEAWAGGCCQAIVRSRSSGSARLEGAWPMPGPRGSAA
jgi:hypothetical protein